MKNKTYNQNAVIRGALRRAFARSPVVQEIMKASRKEEPRYNKDGSRHKKNWVKRQCEVCMDWYPTSKMAVDHIEPVVSVEEGFQDWNEFIRRLWCDKENLQRICDDCHDKKTKNERDYRSSIKDAETLSQIKDDLYTRDVLPQEHKNTLKRIAKKQGPHFEANTKLASDLLARFFPKKKGKT